MVQPARGHGCSDVDVGHMGFSNHSGHESLREAHPTQMFSSIQVNFETSISKKCIFKMWPETSHMLFITAALDSV